MRILFVAMANSIHTARWIRQISNQGWEIHLIPSIDKVPLHPYLQDLVTVHTPVDGDVLPIRHLLINLLKKWPHERGSGHAYRLRTRLQKASMPYGMDRIIHQLQPDIVHSMEFQHAAYPTLSSKLRMGNAFPKWIVSNWGSDIYLYGRLDAHKATIQQILAHCDYYACECMRDVTIAKKLGLQGEVLPVVPCGGGFELDTTQALRHPGPVSKRRVILVKGIQSWAGRALVALQALALCADLLKEYRIVLQLSTPEAKLAAQLLAHTTGLQIEFAPHGHYMQAIRRFGSARIHIGLSISDGISQSLIESMMMGAFPIQSYTACGDEWIQNGKSGFLVPPEDPYTVADALRRALTDDALVDSAAAINAEVAQQRLAYAPIKEKVVGMYKSVFETVTRTQPLLQRNP